MKSANKRILAQKVAVNNLMSGKWLNQKGLECLMYFFQPEFFERNIIKQLKENGFEKATMGEFYNKLVECLVKLNDPKYIFEFTKLLENLPKDKMAKALVKTRDMSYIKRFANEVEGAPVRLLAEEVCSCASIGEIYSFASEVKNAPIDVLQDEFETRIRRTAEKNTDRKYIIEFAKNVKGANIKDLETVVIELKDATLIYEFATKVTGVNIDKLSKALLDTPTTNKLIISFVEDVYGIKKEHILKFAQIIKNGKDCDEIFRFADLYSCPQEIAEELIEVAIIAK